MPIGAEALQELQMDPHHDSTPYSLPSIPYTAAMKHIGIVGVTAEGAALCYQTICREAQEKLGKYHHPEISIHTRSFHEILAAQEERNWNRVAGSLLDSIRKLEVMGAELIVIPANSVHYAIQIVRQKSPLPILSIVEETADVAMQHGYKSAAVLGVGLTMSGGLYSDALKDRAIEYILPPVTDQEHMNRIIYEEIVPKGTVSDKSLEKLIRVLEKLKTNDCEAAILACTELGIVINEKNSPLPLLDSTRILGKRALEEALL